jgi:hypothetical protein
MAQPFWALPAVAIAGLGVRDITRYRVSYASLMKSNHRIDATTGYEHQVLGGGELGLVPESAVPTVHKRRNGTHTLDSGTVGG